MTQNFNAVIDAALPSLKAHTFPTSTPEDRINKALSIAINGLMTDGDHHKQWSLDQVIRALTGCPIEDLIYEHNGQTYPYQAQGASLDYIALTRQTCYRPDGTAWNWWPGQAG